MRTLHRTLVVACLVMPVSLRTSRPPRRCWRSS